MNVQEVLDKYEARSMHGQLPVVWKRAKDCYVWDTNDKKYIDFTSGICVANAGHSNASICNAIRKQTNGELLHSYTFPTEIRAKFIKELVDTCYPGGKAFLTSAGTEATEVACKLMRMYTKKNVLVSFKGSMHGRTMLTEQLKNNNPMTKQKWVDSSVFIENLDFPTKDSNFYSYIDYICSGEIAGIIIESYQGWSAKFYPKMRMSIMTFLNPT